LNKARDESGRHDRRWLISVAGIAFLAAFLYLPSLGGDSIWDDRFLIHDSSQSVRDCFRKPLLQKYYRPLVEVSFVAERKLHGLTPIYFHQTNILLHVVTVILIIMLLRVAFGRKDVALLGGLAFALQPAQVGAVAWIGGRTDSLCELFVVLFCLSTIKAAKCDGLARQWWLASSAMAYAFAVFAKEQSALIILLIPSAIHIWGIKPDDSRGKQFVRVIPHALVLVLYILLYKSIGLSPGNGPRDSILDSLVEALRSAAYYSALFVLPSAKWMHTFSMGALYIAGSTSLLLGAISVAAAASLYLVLRSKRPEAGWFLALAAITIMPALNLIPLSSLRLAPYRAGLAGIGVAAIVGWAFAELIRSVYTCRRSNSSFASAGRYILAAAACSWVFWCGGLSWWGAGRWADEMTVTREIVRQDPDSLWARLNLSSYEFNTGDPLAAAREIEDYLDHAVGRSTWRAPGWPNLDVVEFTALERSIRLVEGSKDSPIEMLSDLFSRLGSARLKLKDNAGAVSALRTAVKLNGRNSDAYMGLGEAAYNTGNYPDAESWLRSGLALDSATPGAWRILGKCYAAEGKLRESERAYFEVVKQAPWSGDAALDLAEMQIKRGERSAARRTLINYGRSGVKREDLDKTLAGLTKETGDPPGS
jgi:Flp pilus assembly protein TadD